MESGAGMLLLASNLKIQRDVHQDMLIPSPGCKFQGRLSDNGYCPTTPTTALHYIAITAAD